MSEDQFTEVTRTGIFGRLSDSIKSMAFGFLLLIAAFPLLWLNEGSAVRRANTLDAGADVVVSISPNAVRQGQEGKLVHLSGLASNRGIAQDPDFGVSANALNVIRTVEMYQWDERSSTKTSTELGGTQETTTTYSYSKKWSEDLINSSFFKRPSGHQNPDIKLYDSASWVAELVTVGAYTLPANMVRRIEGAKAINVPKALMDSLDEDLRANVSRLPTGFYYGANPSSPAIGDLRITFSAVPPTQVSVVAQQVGNSFGPYRMEQGSIDLLETGSYSAEQMFMIAHEDNNTTTWLIRLGGFVMMGIGFSILLAPLAVLADVIPILGAIVRAGTSIVAGALALVLSLVTIALAWLAYRPLISIGLIVIAVAGVVLVKMLLDKRTANSDAEPDAATS